MRIPRTLKIGKRKVRVHKVRALKKRTGAYGIYDSDPPRIRIDSDQSQYLQRVTFIHEILHAIFPRGVVSLSVEEKIVESMDTPLYELLKKNRLIK